MTIFHFTLSHFSCQFMIIHETMLKRAKYNDNRYKNDDKSNLQITPHPLRSANSHSKAAKYNSSNAPPQSPMLPSPTSASGARSCQYASPHKNSYCLSYPLYKNRILVSYLSPKLKMPWLWSTTSWITPQSILRSCFIRFELDRIPMLWI